MPLTSLQPNLTVGFSHDSTRVGLMPEPIVQGVELSAIGHSVRTQPIVNSSSAAQMNSPSLGSKFANFAYKSAKPLFLAGITGASFYQLHEPSDHPLIAKLGLAAACVSSVALMTTLLELRVAAITKATR